jgi:hypothetical protein
MMWHELIPLAALAIFAVVVGGLILRPRHYFPPNTPPWHGTPGALTARVYATRLRWLRGGDAID